MSPGDFYLDNKTICLHKAYEGTMKLPYLSNKTDMSQK